MNKKVIIIGNGVHSKVVANIIKLNNDSIMGFVVEEGFDHSSVLDLTYLGDISVCETYRDECEFIVGIGNNQLREKFSNLDVHWYTAIHPQAVIDDTAVIECGTCVMATAVVNSSAHVGKHCIINTGAIVEHDCVVGDFTHLSPNAAICGCVKVGHNVHIGAGATVINTMEVCSNVTIGAGGCVVKSILEEGTYVGVPAKKVIK